MQPTPVFPGNTPFNLSDPTTELQFDLGQIVLHEDLQQEGVVIGWDSTFKLTPKKLNHLSIPDHDYTEQTANLPWLYIFCQDNRMRYVSQTKLRLVNTPWATMGRVMERYFSHWDKDTNRYKPTYYLRQKYPAPAHIQPVLQEQQQQQDQPMKEELA